MFDAMTQQSSNYPIPNATETIVIIQCEFNNPNSNVHWPDNETQCE